MYKPTQKEIDEFYIRLRKSNKKEIMEKCEESVFIIHFIMLCCRL